ncbi:MAG: hypothetical protein WA816_01650 [Bacteroidales bacterium]
MKTPFFIIAFLGICLECFGISNGRILLNELNGCSNEDSILVNRVFGTLKINPIQPIFSEIPVSFEIYRTPKRSLQFQVGFIFPRRNSKMNQTAFNSNGEEGMATDKGLFSYRRSPFNNDGGINLKMEIRNYSREINSPQTTNHKKSFYYAPQFTYKYCFYKDQTFAMHYNGFSHYQTESKYSNILGFGIMIGIQSSNHSFVTDWYGGLGFRCRSTSVTIHEIYSPYALPGTTIYPDTNNNDVSFYPFVNLGVRLGFDLKKNHL